MLTLPIAALALVVSAEPAAPANIIAPTIIENRTVAVTQTVTLKDIPAGAKQLRLWVPVPSDTNWQRIVDRQVVSAPGKWQLVRQSEGRGDFVVVDVTNPAAGEAKVVVNCTFDRQGVTFPLDNAQPAAIQSEQFDLDLDRAAPLMAVDARIQKMADDACKDERDPAKQAVMLMHVVADAADHYSKDPTKPKCGRGSAEDCLTQGGGCCTDLHSLYIALARARGIPTRLQYGYRLLDAKAGPTEYDPGYRCWIEVFIPGAGWVPTDIVAADGAKEDVANKWAALSATRVWLWQGRSFELTPPAATDRIDTMICGWAEIDGKAVDVLPAADGAPSKLTRTVKFEVLKTDRKADTPKIAE